MSNPFRDKPYPKHRRVADALRRRIVSGELTPGQRLPTRAEFAEEFDLAPSVVQTIIEQLRRAGFVETRVPAGTFVAMHPPHLHRFAMIQPALQEDSLWWEANVQAARLIDSVDKRIVVAESIDGHADREQYQQLVADILMDRLAGLIFTNSPHLLTHTPLMQLPNVPRVAYVSSIAFPGVVSVGQDDTEFTRRAVEFLISRGRKRIAVVAGFAKSAAEIGGPMLERFLAPHDVTIPPYWRLALYPIVPSAARGVIHLLFKGTGGARPDGVIILDDHLINVVVDGMTDAGLESPRDVDLVAIANYPAIKPTLMPVTRLGFDTRDALRKSIGFIEAMRRNEPVPALTLMPALFENELTPPLVQSSLLASPRTTAHTY